MKQRVLNILITLDQFLFCVLCLGNTRPDETASEVAWLLERDGKVLGKIFRPLIDAIFFLQPNHCKSAFDAAQRRAKARLGEQQ